MTCSSCRYRFVFNPKQDGFTDGKMAALIRKVSANDTYYFTFNQLFSEHCRRTGLGIAGYVVGAVILFLIVPGAVLLLKNPVGLVLAVGLAVLGVLIVWGSWYHRGKVPPEPHKLRAFVNRWGKTGLTGSLAKLLEAPRLHTRPPEWPESDIYDYGVERILIVEHELLVDLFVLNGFHSENRALVLSESGYPKYLLPQAVSLLKQRPDLPVFLLHDASRDLVSMADRVAKHPQLPVSQHPIIDTGLFPEDVVQLKGLRRINAHKMESAVPVDFLLYATLSSGLSDALMNEMTLAALINANKGSPGDSPGGFG